MNRPESATAVISLPVLRSLRRIGRTSESVFTHAGQLGQLSWNVLRVTVRLQVSPKEILNQVYIMGIQSLPIVMVTAALSGIVTSQQGGYQFTGSVPLYVLGSLVAQTIVLEMGPVLTAIVLVGRVGARITAELGTMKVSEQIDAFHALGRDPIAILAAPRVIAGVISMPLLVAIANIVGIYAGMLAAEITVGLGREAFFYGARLFWHNWDLLYSLTKATVFGLAIPVISVHMGLQTRGGAEGVGRTTTAAVMFMILTVLILDAMFPPLMLN